MSSLRIGIFAFLGGVALFVQSSMAYEASFQHKDWELVCDNTRTCRAAGYGYQVGDGEGLVSMLLTREAGPNTSVSMELQLRADAIGNAPTPTEAHLQVGWLIIPKFTTGKVPKKEAVELLAVMPDEEELLLTAGDTQWVLSLAGLKAMLLKMDDKQGRIGTPGALIAKGTKPEQQVLPPVPMKTLAVPVIPPTTKEDEKVLAALKEFLTAACTDEEADYCKTERKIERLSEDKLLMSQLVDRGLYNQTVAVYVVNDKPPYNPKPAIEGGLIHDVMTDNVGFEVHDKGILNSSTRNSTGDCWYSASWAWTGISFEKAAEYPIGMCKGTWDLPTFVSEVANEYKAPSGGWKLLVKEDKVHTRTGNASMLIAVSPEGKQIHIDDGIRKAEAKWLNGETIEIIDNCGLGSECRYVYFYDIHKGLSRVFLDAIAFSIADNIIAYPSYNEKKKRTEIVVSEIYTDKKEPIAVIYRKWSRELNAWTPLFPAEQAVNKGFFLSKDKLHLEYEVEGSEETRKVDISLKKEPPFFVCDEKDGIETYCSTKDYEKETGYIWFAAEQPPAVDINLPNEAPLCYKFPALNLAEQLEKMKKKYGTAIHDEKVVKHADGGSTLFLKRKDESGKEVEYFYFDGPKLCTEHQIQHFGEIPPIPFYDYDGCGCDECCKGAVWPVIKKTALRKSYSKSSPIIGMANVGQEVDVLNGITITKQPGVIKISEDRKLHDGTEVKKGDVAYVLYWSEINWVKAWHDGKIKDIDLLVSEEDQVDQTQLISEIWLKIETADGTVGWTNELRNFEQDYCHNEL